MYILTSSYSKPPETVKPHFKAHCEWLNKYIKEGIFLASGPKTSQLGGAVLVRSIDKKKLMQILAEDSYVKEDVADYVIVEMDCKLATHGFEKLIGA